MKNLIFVALLVSVMLVLTVGTAFAFEGEKDDPVGERQADTSGGGGGSDGFVGELDDPNEDSETASTVELSGDSGGSGGPIVAEYEAEELSDNVDRGAWID